MHDYKAGKADGLAGGLPPEGRLARTPRIGDVVRWDIPVCRLSDRIGEIRGRVEAAGWQECVVTNQEGIVLGVLRRKALDADPQATAGAVMEPGPSTYRPHVPVTEMREHMREHGLSRVLVTTSEGRLLGMLRREEIEILTPAVRQPGQGQPPWAANREPPRGRK